MTPEYPKWKYHPSKTARVVHDPKQEESLGPEWADRPFRTAPVAPPVPVNLDCENCATVVEQMNLMRTRFDEAWKGLNDRYTDAVQESDQLKALLEASVAVQNEMRVELAQRAKDLQQAENQVANLQQAEQAHKTQNAELVIELAKAREQFKALEAPEETAPKTRASKK